MFTRLSIGAFVLVAGCAGDSAGCTKDTDCKGDRICTAGQCVDPAAPPTEDVSRGDEGAGRDAVEPEPLDPDELIGPCTLLGVSEADSVSHGTVLLGSLLPRSGGLATIGLSMERAVALALSEINQNGGIGGRPIGVIACDTAAEPEVAAAAAQHLVDVGVPAVVGPATSGVTIPTLVNVARPGKLLLMSPSATSPEITSLDDDGLLWRTAPSDALAGAALAGLVLAEGVERVVLLYSDDGFGASTKDAFLGRFCGPFDCDGGLVSLSWEPGTGGSALDALAQDAASFDPGVVVILGGGPPLWGLVDGLHARGIVGLRLVDMGAAELALQVERPDLLCHVLGVRSVIDAGPERDAFVARYQARWSEPPGLFSAHAYDATWSLAWAIATVRNPDARLSGPVIAGGIERLVGGPPTAVGPDAWIAQAGEPVERVDLEGASGSLSFDLATGDVPGSVAAWTFQGDETVDLGVVLPESGGFQEPSPLPPCDAVP